MYKTTKIYLEHRNVPKTILNNWLSQIIPEFIIMPKCYEHKINIGLLNLFV